MKCTTLAISLLLASAAPGALSQGAFGGSPFLDNLGGGLKPGQAQAYHAAEKVGVAVARPMSHGRVRWGNLEDGIKSHQGKSLFLWNPLRGRKLLQSDDDGQPDLQDLAQGLLPHEEKIYPSVDLTPLAELEAEAPAFENAPFPRSGVDFEAGPRGRRNVLQYVDRYDAIDLATYAAGPADFAIPVMKEAAAEGQMAQMELTEAMSNGR
ncbi:hypothetical protein HOP50_01g09580 [Chloropicon primus]|uniref:Uncharacterized protein n=1 Tax=Chloropicon primus TaxID=1764295 RepID=A0A5B8ME64_9CHLO|nr:hypothetical protein A3770_01p09720 [Chloropicon primus]UPQ97663.1 hypothetical protein HOP50_01g09580 [Chloropicon primus]|mmetsp:Transcript_10827/g.30466  ORF Transcript_10827/g.30466 Transcript_10827/m.30466 type:complete len:209 (-) Transcript_10827:114-740(-)|eukprot:QDZ18454.1 hypothetical protein A3770_01p09720 [Chloropicon primus]